MTIYSAGLRISELAALKPEHIDSKQMLIKVEKGKGGHQRYTTLSLKLLKELRHYYKTCQPHPYLFPSTYKGREGQPLTNQALQAIYYKACKSTTRPAKKRASRTAPAPILYDTALLPISWRPDTISAASRS
jgi:integrase